MKKTTNLLMALGIMTLSLSSCYLSQSTADNSQSYYEEPTQNVDYDVFYSSLSPYGRWVNYSGYGQVWICNDNGFRPYYSGGHWAYTTYGWTWVSNYNWGWAPFHYGRWGYDPFYGWFWVPGYQWAPAWVGWRNGGGYYGWAPLAPGMQVGAGMSYNNIPANNWTFVPQSHISNTNINNYYVNNTQNTTIINNTTIVNNTDTYGGTRFVSGPTKQEVENNAGIKINTVPVKNVTNPAQITTDGTPNGGEVKIYRPVIKNTPRNTNNNNGNTGDAGGTRIPAGTGGIKTTRPSAPLNNNGGAGTVRPVPLETGKPVTPTPAPAPETRPTRIPVKTPAPAPAPMPADRKPRSFETRPTPAQPSNFPATRPQRSEIPVMQPRPATTPAPAAPASSTPARPSSKKD
jgi:hypothetical protein